MSQTPIPHSYWILADQLLAGEYPGNVSAGKRYKKLEQLLEAGINCFIDLTQPDELPDYASRLGAGIRHYRKPIRDHELPANTAQMQDIINTIEAELRDRRRIYLHCRAGIGRTGTVAGCFLEGRGHSGEQALDELNHLWQQNGLSEVWPTIPETPEQEDYVRHWRGVRSTAATSGVDTELDGDSALRAVGSLRDRFHGALLGLAVGDALAAATQFRRPGSFTLVGDLLGGGPHDLPRGAWSDDTAMALCLAESLITQRAFDPNDQVRQYLQWQSAGHLSATGECVGITGTVARALATAQWRRQPFAGSHDPKQIDAEPLSRLAPVVMFAFADGEQALALSAESARITCQAPTLLDCCRLQSAMLHAALSGATRQTVLRPTISALNHPPLKPAVAKLIATTVQPGEQGTLVVHGADAVAALGAARWAFASTRNFRDGALAAVNLGGRSDVIGAVYGQLAGAFYGVDAIPSAWRTALVRRDKIEALADALLAHALTMLGISESA